MANIRRAISGAASGYIVAAAGVALAALVRYLLDPVLGWEAPLPIFIMPVVVAAAYRGFYPGLFATTLGALAGEYLFVEPRGAVTWNSVEQVRLTLFLIEGTAVSFIVEQVHKARRRIQRGEAALLASEAHYRAFFELVSVGTGYVDARTGRFIDVNEALCNITGYSREELLKRTFSDITHPEDRDIDRERYWRLVSGEVHAYSTEKRYLRKDGGVIWVHVEVAAVRGLGGELVRSVGIILDITGRKRAEEEAARQAAAAESERRRLRVVLDLLPVAVFIADAEGHIRETNPAAVQLWGGEARFSGIGEYGRDYKGWWPQTGRPLESYEWGMARALSRGEHCIAEEVEIEAFDGSRKAILNYALPIRDEEGHISGGVAINVDITDRKRAEEVLRESEQRLRATFDNAGVGISEADAEGRIVLANERFCRLVGRSLEELRGMTVREITHPDDRALTDWYLGELVEGHRSGFSGEKRYLRGDGTAVWARFTTSAVRDEQGRYVRGIVVAEDITERKRAEEALRESEERLRLAIDSTELGAFDYDLRSGRAVWSEYAKRHFGLPPDEQADSNVFRSAVHPEDREQAEGAARAALRPESGGQYATEFRTIGIQDGRERWISARGRVFFDAQGRAERMLGVTLDVTERKRAEAALRESEARERARASELEAIMDAAPAVIFISRDPECRNIVGNRASYELLRQAVEANLSKSAIDAPHLSNFRPMKDGREIPVEELPMQKAGRTGQPVRNYELDFVFDDGTRRTVLGDAVPLLDGEGRTWGVAAVFLDITDRKRSEERLLQSQKLESVGLLAGGVAHDFNNLLVGIVGNASLAQELLPPGSPAVELMESVVKIGEKAANLTRQMLAYAGKGRFVIEPVNLSDLVREMSELVRPSLSKKVALRLDLAPDLPAIEADRGQLQQVVMNLVLNAAEAIGEKAGMVSVRTSATEVDERHIRRNVSGGEVRRGTYACLEVRDTGSGMDEATLSRIFDPFFSTKFTGRGLGLAAVAGIVRGHRGAIYVESAPGKGSCFEVLFPAIEGMPEKAETEAHAAAVRGSGTVLVVDDEQIVREVASKALERSGFKVLLADSGRAAIDLFKRYPGEIAAVVLDLSMPEMSGEETLPELRRIRPGVKVLVSSGYSEAEVMRMFSDGQVYGFIQKPYTSLLLAEKVKAALS